MADWLPPTLTFSPFGLLAPYTSAVNTTISGNTTIANQNQFYGNLTINNGIVLTAGFSPQIIVCNQLSFGNTSSQISANSLGGAGGALAATGKGGLIDDDQSGAIANTGTDWFSSIFANGGKSGTTGGTVGLPGAAGAVTNPTTMLAMMAMGCKGGGGGGGGNAGTPTTVAGGMRGGAGLAGGNGSSGTGGGGGGGSGNSANSTGGAGGGAVLIICDSIVGAAGLITANGANGGSPGGGGGGGGLVLVYARTVLVSPTLQANGGSGTAGSNHIGGNGGAGLTCILRSV